MWQIELWLRCVNIYRLGKESVKSVHLRLLLEQVKACLFAVIEKLLKEPAAVCSTSMKLLKHQSNNRERKQKTPTLRHIFFAEVKTDEITDFLRVYKITHLSKYMAMAFKLTKWKQII